MSDQPVIVRMKHVRACNLCASGVRRWYIQQGFNWSDFLTNGKSADELEATGDPVAQQVSAIAREEARNG